MGVEISGRELDAAVAGHVMGWREAEHPERHGTGQWMSEYAYPVYYKQNGQYIESGSFMPSEEIEAAMQVVEKMWRTGWQMESANGYKLHTRIVDNVCSWYVRFINNESDMDNWSAEADTLPLAICKAALKAIQNSERAREAQQEAGK